MTETVPLSGSHDFAAISVIGGSDIVAGTIIHTATSVPGEYDMVTLVAQNALLGRSVELTLCVPLLDPDVAIMVSIHGDQQPVGVLDDFWMTDGSVLRAIASKDDVVTVKGFVSRQGSAAATSINKIASIAPSGQLRVTNLYVVKLTEVSRLTLPHPVGEACRGHGEHVHYLSELSAAEHRGSDHMRRACERRRERNGAAGS